MNQLVFIENGKIVTDSLTVAEVFLKTHKNVLRDIKTQLDKLTQAGEGDWGVLNFEPTQYQQPSNKQMYPKFNLTEDAFVIVAMSYVTPEAMKMKVKFLKEFHRMKEQLSSPQPMSHLEVTQAAVQALVEQDKRITDMESRLTKLEANSVTAGESTSKWYSTTDIAIETGMSVRAIGLLATKHKMRAPQYSKVLPIGSNKGCPLRIWYNEEGRNKWLEIVKKVRKQRRKSA